MCLCLSLHSVQKWPILMVHDYVITLKLSCKRYHQIKQSKGLVYLVAFVKATAVHLGSDGRTIKQMVAGYPL